MQIVVPVGKKFPEINGAASDDFAEEMLRVEDSDFEEVILDFEGTENINSMAMGCLFSTHQKLQEQDRTLRIIHVEPRIRRLLKVANLESIVEDD